MSCMWMRPTGRRSASMITRLVISHVSITSSALAARSSARIVFGSCVATSPARSEEHTSELQSHSDLVCRLLLEKKKKKKQNRETHDVQEVSDVGKIALTKYNI